MSATVAAPSAGDGEGHLKSRVGLDLEAQVRQVALETLCRLFTTEGQEEGFLMLITFVSFFPPTSTFVSLNSVHHRLRPTPPPSSASTTPWRSRLRP